MTVIAKLTVSLKSPSFPFGALIFAHYLNVSKQANIDIKVIDTEMSDAVFQDRSLTISGSSHVLRYLAKTFDPVMYSTDPYTSSMTDFWVDFCQDNLLSNDFKKVSSVFENLNQHLKLRSFIVGYQLRLADIAVWGALRSNPVFNKQIKANKDNAVHLSRWYNHVASLDFVQVALEYLEAKKVEINKSKKDQGSFDIGLKDAEYGKVVTRFPPEPSGYLHIGHAKAALLNDYFAKQYSGKLIVRFDDTNPSKEKDEFENSIKEDLALIGITADVVTHTSDYFDQLKQYAIGMIEKGLAYVDDTDQETMRAQRMEGISSKNRSLSVEENLKLFKEMELATEHGLKCCLRAKIDMTDLNKAMRDPVIYRCNLTPHHRTGSKYKMYPTYDFACPIVDSIEGVTHALRTNEYRARNPQYEWFLKAMDLRWVHIWDYSRLNFVYTLLSKRKLTWFVEQGLVTGWDDPRFPTVRGIRRRGMTIDALRTYILMQGASQSSIMLEWDKIWTVNKKIIDPVAPRYTAMTKKDLVLATISDKVEAECREFPLHKKNPAVGTKLTSFASTIYLEQEDALLLNVGDEFTLMDWGNAIVKSFVKNQKVESIELDLNLAGDFKKTKYKLSWLAAQVPKNKPDHKVIDIVLKDYDFLINKKKLEEEDSVQDFLSPVTEFTVEALGDANLKSLKKGDIIQFERKGYYILDCPDKMEFISIPDGKSASVGSKQAAATQASAASQIKMYKTGYLYGAIASIDPKKVSKMYVMKPILSRQ